MAGWLCHPAGFSLLVVGEVGLAGSDFRDRCFDQAYLVADGVGYEVVRAVLFLEVRDSPLALAFGDGEVLDEFVLVECANGQHFICSFEDAPWWDIGNVEHWRT